MNTFSFWLHQFEGGDGGAAAPAAGTMGDSQSAAPVNTQRGKSGENVLYGKQAVTDAQDTPSDAGKAETDVKVTSNALEDKRKAFSDMINGEYKDVYTENTQRIINRRFSEMKNLQAQLEDTKPVLDALRERYGVEDAQDLLKAIDSDHAYWTEAAEEAGMNEQQYREFVRMRRENEAFRRAAEEQENQKQVQAQVQQWMQDAEALRQKFPQFDLSVEMENPTFMSMLKAGTPVEHAYKVMHFDEIMSGAMQQASIRTEKNVTENIRARGMRPAENGTARQSAFIIKDDVSKLTKKDRAEIARRAARGETIRF